MRTIKRVIFILILSLLYATVKAQTIPASLDTVLTHTLDSMYNVMGIKSLNAAIQFPDGTIWANAVGISAQNVSVTPNDAYLIGSVTKTLTAACILQLVDEQILSLDDSLYMWLDTIQYINPNITIRQLLRHQSGIYDVLNNQNCQPALLANMDSIWAPQDLISTFIKPAIAQPGGAWSYCNTNYFLLGMIIKAATGNPFYTEIRNRFFTPLGLNTFAIPAYETITSPVAHVWLDINGNGITDDAHSFYMNYLSLNSVAGAAGGYFSTATDLSKWMKAYMSGTLHSPSIMAQAQTTVPASGMPGGTYGLGLMKKSFAGYLGYGHGGDLAYSASSWYFPSKDVSISVLGNDADFNSWTLAPVVEELLKNYLIWQLTASVEDVAQAKLALQVFPNPFDNQVFVKMNLPENAQELTCILSNAMGENLATIQENHLLKGQEQVFSFENITDLPQGFYFVRTYINGNLVQTAKLVK